jgi:photosystem II stability/assembly factor-like uncharacterized protein
MRALKIIFSLIFVCSGIYSQNFWHQTNGPYGGSIYSMETSLSGNIFCSTFSGGGIYKSTNNGNSWFKVFGDDRDSWSWEIVTDKYSNLYASCSGHGIIKSTDDGNTWIQLSSMLTPQALAVNNNGHIFAGLNAGGIYRSTNNGINWVMVNFGANGVRKLLIKPNGYIYAAYPPYIKISTDNGDTWNQINYTGMTGGNDMSLDSSGNLLVCNSSGIFKTSNDGVNWLQICTIPSLISIAVSGNGIIFAGNSYGIVYKSVDNGTNWTVALNQEVIGGGSSVMDILIKPDGKIFAGYQHIGIFRSLNEGLLWEKSNNGLTNQRMAGFAVNGNKIFAGTFHDGLYYTTNKGYDWIAAGLEKKYVMQMGTNGPDNIFLYTPEEQGGMFRSTNGGMNWQELNSNLPPGNVNQFLKVSNGFFAATENGIYKTTDNGDSWIYKGPFAYRFRYIKANLNQVIFASSDSRLFRSTNLGDNWEILDSLGYNLRGFCLSGNGNVYALYSNRLYMSSSLGTNWLVTDSTANFGVITSGEDGTLFVTDWDGVYRSIDNGANWMQINSGLTFPDVVTLDFDEDGYLYAGTGGAGVFRSVNPVLNINHVGNTHIDRYSLSQNYPNPFNPSTNIKFQIPLSRGVSADGGRGVSVRLLVYDLLGREIQTLVNQQLQPGSYNVDWDASNYPSGVYFYKLESNGFVESKKMVLIK